MKTLSEFAIICEGTDCMTKFGHLLFADELVKYYKKQEPNTEYEKSFLDLLREYTYNSYGDSLSYEFLQGLKDLKDCFARNALIKPPSGPLYRGLFINDTKLIHKIFGKFELEHIPNIKDTKFSDIIDMFITSFSPDNLLGVKKIPTTYKPKYSVESWTEDLKTAMEYASNFYTRKPDEPVYAVIIEYTKSNRSDFLFNSKVIADILATDKTYDEIETIRFGKKSLPVNAYILAYTSPY